MNPLGEIDIANMALTYAGISQQLQSFDDKNPQAKSCKQWYPIVRDQVLQSAPWSFALTSQVLASDGSNIGPANTQGANFAFAGWKYGYQYPNDALQVIAVTNLAGRRNGWSIWGEYWGSYGRGRAYMPKMPYEISQSTTTPGQRMIACDYGPSSPLYCWFIGRITDTGLFTPLFCEALAQALGWRVGLATRSSEKDRIAGCKADAGKALYAALAQVLNEQQQDREATSPSISVR